MPKRPTVGELIVYPAKGGLETISIPGTTTLGRLTDGTNFIVDINGAKKRSPGTIQQSIRFEDSTNVQIAAPNNNARGLFDFWRTSGSTKVRRTTLVAGGRVWADNGNGIYVDVTGSFSIIPTNNVSMETFFGLLVIAFENNPTNVPLKYDQTALAALGGTPPNAKYLRTWLNRLWAGGVGASPDRLYGSVVDNPEDWTIVGGAVQINIDQGDQDPIGITSLFPPFYGRMIVGKRRSLFEVTPSGSTFAVRNVITGLGCVSHNGIASIDTDIIFPSERGIHSLVMTDKLGEIETAFLSAPIQNYYQENISFERAQNMQALYVPEMNSYFLSATTKKSATNDVVLVYNFAIQEWSKIDENVSTITRYVDTTDANKTKVLIANDSGQIGVIDTTKSGRTLTWFGSLRTMQFTTGLIYPLGPTKEVTFRELKIFFKPSVTNSVLNVSYRVNAQFIEDLSFPMDPLQAGALIGSAIVGVDKIGTSGIVKCVTRSLRGVGAAIELVFTHTPVATDDDCEIYGFTIEYEYSGEMDQPKQQ